MILTGSFLIERIYNIDGFGLLGYESLVERDYPVVMGILVISSLLFLVGNILSDVCVAIVDPVTTRTTNLYGELQDELGATRTAISRAAIYAVSCRGEWSGNHWTLKAWEHELAIGARLPTLPIWLTETFFVPLDLEASYETTCRSLRIV